MGLTSLGRAFSSVAAADPDAPSVTCDGLTTTRRALEALSNRMARHFAALGVGQGDMVTIGLPNSAEFFAATLATWKLGAIPQPVSSRLPDIERQAIVELADSKLIIGADADAHPGRLCLPLGWRPDVTIDPAPLEDDPLSPVWKAPTSGGSTGRPKLILASDPASIDLDAPQGIGAEHG
ncbi:MAG TPA: AMP-binding protein, partial [Ilumatobacteraceae bacterium]|nr:AMP-binding protein [Ilumatobacteraceae bacterium]